MTQWSIWGGFMKKTRGQKSRATVPLNWFGQKIPSGPLINHLKYFRFGFWICLDFNFSCILFISNIRPGWFLVFWYTFYFSPRSSQCTHSFDLHIKKYARRKSIWRFTFCVISTKAQIQSVHTVFSVYIWISFLEFKSKQIDSIRIFNKCGQRNRVIRNEIVFLTAFQETLLQKWRGEELLDLKPTRN